eukprot:scaffold30171_cov41-Prasinocladus_malaysianus.AAC.1
MDVHWCSLLSDGPLPPLLAQTLLSLYTFGRQTGCVVDIGHGKIGEQHVMIDLVESFRMTSGRFIQCFRDMLHTYETLRLKICLRRGSP